MVRPYTGGGVAGMQDNQTIGDRSVVDDPTQTMGGNWLLMPAYRAVAPGDFMPLPQPTGVRKWRAVDLGPKAFFNRPCRAIVAGPMRNPVAVAAIIGLCPKIQMGGTDTGFVRAFMADDKSGENLPIMKNPRYSMCCHRGTPSADLSMAIRFCATHPQPTRPRLCDVLHKCGQFIAGCDAMRHSFARERETFYDKSI